MVRRWVLASCSVLLLSLLAVRAPTAAAATFADTAFQTQWQQGEAIVQNFWGPLANAKDGQPEVYKEAQGGQRIVQYFDKGRMELTNGGLTNGLLATEMVKGQIQTGDNQFQSLVSPAIPIAGDPTTPAPRTPDWGPKRAHSSRARRTRGASSSSSAFPPRGI